MNAVLADYQTGGGPSLVVDWVRMSPYPASGTFLSRVLDASGPVDWGTVAWTAATPAGTSIVLSVLTGDTSTPDGTWTDFSPISNGGSVGHPSRYLQYRAELATSKP